ncbi:MAG: hypothetical protein ACR2JM_13770 [Mycobacterium sp.]
MNLTPVAVVAALAAAGFGLAAPAGAADANTLGTYTFEADGGESSQWALTPCAVDTDNCVHIASSGSDKRAPWSADAYLTVGSWILFIGQPDAAQCGNGTTVSGVNNYSWDASSLSGYMSINDVNCGGEKPESIATPFTLTKTGSPPVMPTGPISVEPYIVDIPPPYVPPAGAPAPAPMPAEADPALVATPPVVAPNPYELTEAEVASPGFNAVPGGEKR